MSDSRVGLDRLSVFLASILSLGLFVWPCLAGESPLILKGTEVYEALGLKSLAVVENQIFMVDYHGGRLLTFDGDRARQIAGKGEGPGELQRPSWITVRDGRLLIKDLRNIHVFDARGQFIETIRLPSGLDYVGMLEDEMLFLSGLGYGQLKNPLELFLQSMESEERTTLASWAPELERNPRAERTDFRHTKLALELTHAWMMPAPVWKGPKNIGGGAKNGCNGLGPRIGFGARAC